jgi:tRNA 2-thiouridine synthesizing protein B
MALHTLAAAPTSAAFNDCLRLVAPGDTLLLLGDGVYTALQGTAARAGLEASGADVYLLHEDASAAGVLDRLGGLPTIDMDGFVALTEQFSQQLAWY